jgi:glycosyltransferase involved in cell wall biosynthesis
VLARTFLAANYFRKKYKVPYIVSEQWSGYLPEDGMYRGFLKKRLTQRAVKYASAVTTVSESLKNAMISHGLKNEYTIIPNVVDVNQFYPSAERIQEKKFFFLTVADMDDRAKNISGTIRVMKNLSEIRQDFEYHLIGGGEDFGGLKKLAQENNILNSFVFFHGPKKSVEVSEMMRRADVFILFSNYDNMPCVMTEALASGLPVIGSAIHGMKEHIKEGLGFLVAPGDENALLNAIQKMMSDINLFDKNYLRQYAKDNFSYEGVAEKFDQIYSNILRK